MLWGKKSWLQKNGSCYPRGGQVRVWWPVVGLDVEYSGVDSTAEEGEETQVAKGALRPGLGLTGAVAQRVHNPAHTTRYRYHINLLNTL